MSYLQNINTNLFRAIYCTSALIAFTASFMANQAHANIESGWSGSIQGGIPAITRESSSGKPFWCNQYGLLHKKCRVVDISPSKRVAIVNQPRPDANCPNGVWGIVDRESGIARSIVPDNHNKVTFEQYCRGNFNIGFVKTSNPNVLAKVVVYFNNQPVDSLEYATK
ncbi:hypothetical protein CH64_1552 [Yersinia rohdei]|uniref:Uncharacterized protein n=2 Tax=Yersinia rohdei TaxID=29485 RepID=A0ABM5S8W2_YERRO|nr:hypothetical protein CH64_1552 [Yersinia rohdei]